MKTIFQALAEIEQANQTAALCTVVRSQGSTPRHSSSKMIVYPDGSILGSVGGGEMEYRVIEEAQQAILDGHSRYLVYNLVDPQQGDPGVCGGEMEVYVEPISSKPVIVVLGAGHVGKAVAALAHWLGFWVAVWDDRPEFCNAAVLPDANRYVVCPIEELPNQLELNQQCYLALTTHGLDLDIQGLPYLLDKPVAYLGVIGSRRRWLTTRQRLLEQGINPELLNRISTPIGLDIKAETPEEIAVSILAEIIMLRNGGHGGQMKLQRDNEKT